LQIKLADRAPFEEFWRKAAIDGGVFKDVGSPKVSLSPAISGVKFANIEIEGTGDMYFLAYPSYRLLDGRGGPTSPGFRSFLMP